MKLFIEGIEDSFQLDKLELTSEGLSLVSDSLFQYIQSLIEPEAIEEPPAPKKLEYRETEKMGAYTRDQYETTGWTVEQMVAEGLLEAVEITESIPPGTKAPPAAPTEEAPAETPDLSNALKINGTYYEMTPKAAGATYEEFMATKGWTNESLITEGYLSVVEGSPEPEPTWPKQENDQWIDSAGDFFDEALHSMTKAKLPGVTKKGVFCKRRNVKKVPAAPAAKAPEETTEEQEAQAAEDTAVPTKSKVPAAPTTAASKASKASKVPAAPAAASASGQEDEPLDEELESLIKDWG